MGIENPETTTEKKQIKEIDTSREWPAIIDEPVRIQEPDGNYSTITFEEYLKRIGNNNRGGT